MYFFFQGNEASYALDMCSHCEYYLYSCSYFLNVSCWMKTGLKSSFSHRSVPTVHNFTSSAPVSTVFVPPPASLVLSKLLLVVAVTFADSCWSAEWLAFRKGHMTRCWGLDCSRRLKPWVSRVCCISMTSMNRRSGTFVMLQAWGDGHQVEVCPVLEGHVPSVNSVCLCLSWRRWD